MNLNFSTDQSKKISFNTGSYQGFGDLSNYRNQEYWMGLNVKPTNALSISFEPDYNTSNSVLQYVMTSKMGNDSRYIFAELDQKTLSFTFRLNYTFTPELSLEYYGQPFISVGKYTNYKRTTITNAEKFGDRYRNFAGSKLNLNVTNNTYSIDEDRNGTSDYSFSNPDFNFRQFRSNLVIRWEYLPGSTIFLVWSQGRTSSATDGSFAYNKDMKELFGIQPHNVFLIKFSYWFSI